GLEIRRLVERNGRSVLAELQIQIGSGSSGCEPCQVTGTDSNYTRAELVVGNAFGKPIEEGLKSLIRTPDNGDMRSHVLEAPSLQPGRSGIELADLERRLVV